MRVKCVRSFAGSGFSYGMGDEFELPEGVDWLRVGFVVPIESAMLPGALPRDTTIKTLDSLGLNSLIAARKELAALGITNVAQLASADETDLTGIKGVGKVTALRWQTAAREALR